MAEAECAVESKIPSRAFVRALATAAFNADLVAARFAEYTRSALNAPAPAGEARSTPCVPALAVLMVRSFRSWLLPSIIAEPLPLMVNARLLVAAAAPVAAVPALEARFKLPAETFRLEPAVCDWAPEIRSVPAPILLTAPDNASGALISCVPCTTLF